MARTSPRYAVALYRVPTAEQGHSGLGMEAQQASVRAFVTAQSWTLVAEFSDIASGKDDHRPGFQAALARCRQLGAVLVAARLDRITRRAHTLSQLLEDGVSIRAADMPGADDLMMRIYAAMAQKERPSPRLFINAARGQIHDTETLIEAVKLMRRGKLAQPDRRLEEPRPK